ncbi:hypothetical protein HJC23_007496 [Cyclotella cryptica]|uniref:Uncharacterized protein n=1 Tax=Cyclotella cryptica TaxID=29204 RepID=A0ABD3PVT5_9STRA|eukprot:CCRYP_011396-RA/>CCRYP_011396-RA protein AED:0.03 eAED:0.03 QI:389/1/1/1/0.66/0.5/4/370/612
MTQRHLSYSAILVLAANTMNGPGITTLPDVAVDAGIFLYFVLIALSVQMASFVCRRMVHAMWSSLKSDSYFVNGKDDGKYERVDSVESDVMSLFEEDENIVEEEISDVAIQLTELHHYPNQHLEHREFHAKNGTPSIENIHTLESLTTLEAQVDSLHDNVQNTLNGIRQPILERTSIVGQSLEGFGQSTSTFVALTMVASALCLALAQMMLCAAILDGLFVVIVGQSCALGLPSHEQDGTSSWIYCTAHSSMKPYMNSGAPVSIMSVGWVIATAVSVFLGTKHLDEMMGVQYTFFICLLVGCVRFTFVLISMASNLEHEVGITHIVRALESQNATSHNSELSWSIGPSPFQTIGPIMFNFAFIVTAPPLSALAKEEQIASSALSMSCVVMGALYALIGWVGAPVSNAVRNGMISGGDDTNLLSLILLSGGDSGVSTLDLICIGAFGISILASVPVYCLLAQQTLIHDAGVATLPAFVLSNVIPWILVALTYNASFFEAFVNWSGLLILGYANFSLPLILDSRLLKVRTYRATALHQGGENMNGRPNKERRLNSGGLGRATKATSIIFSLVTSSISSVIAISIMPFPSLNVTCVVFVAVMLATLLWPEASMDI